MRLQDSVANVDVAGGALDNEIASVIRKVLQGYNQTYASVTGEDLANLNEAVGLLVCARLITPLSTGGLNYDITSEKLETISRNTAATDGGGEKARWEAEAAQCLALISFITTVSPSLNIIGVNGPSRYRAGHCEGY